MSTLLRLASAALGARIPCPSQFRQCTWSMPQGSCYASFRGVFAGPDDFLITETVIIPNDSQKKFDDKIRIRYHPPHASYYVATPPPVWDNDKHKKPLLWDQSLKSLRAHKALLVQALKDNDADTNDWRSKITLAIAMQETEYMWGRDNSKDNGDWGDKNMWCLNLNALMLSKVGYNASDGTMDLTQPGYLSKVVMYLLRWFDGQHKIDGADQKTPHVASTLNYIRNGPTGYDIEHQPDIWAKSQDNTNTTVCAEYRNAIAASYHYIDKDPGIFFDDYRIGIDVPAI